jgi:hypothetical protein
MRAEGPAVNLMNVCSGVIAKSPGQMVGGAARGRCSSACNASRTAVSS